MNSKQMSFNTFIILIGTIKENIITKLLSFVFNEFT